MKTMENNYYETVNLPKSPYQTLTRTEVDDNVQDLHGNTLPIWPPKPNSFPEVKQSMTLPKTGHNADDFINELLSLNQKRRGIREKSPPKPSHLDLSGSHNLTSPKYRQMTQ